MRRLLPLAAMVWTILGTASIAFAQYPPTSAPAVPTTPPGGAEQGGGTLPFTGASLSMWFALLATLVLAGVVLLLMQRSRQRSYQLHPTPYPGNDGPT
jgi:hypothetical protein